MPNNTNLKQPEFMLDISIVWIQTPFFSARNTPYNYESKEFKADYDFCPKEYMQHQATYPQAD